MKIRGERTCKDCQTQWSYYETGSIECPNCGSLESVGSGQRRLHTASPQTVDLGDILTGLEDEPIEVVAERGAEAAATFRRSFGFIHAGELQPLEKTFVVATELRYAGAELARSERISDEETEYLLSLLQGVQSDERPAPGDVPESMVVVRGLAVCSAVEDYRRDVRQYLDEYPDEAARRVLGRLDDHRKRIEALDGDVPVRKTDALLEAASAVGQYLIDDEATLEPALERLEELDPSP